MININIKIEYTFKSLSFYLESYLLFDLSVAFRLTFLEKKVE